ncbi:PadR family transcriptional regulator [Nocardia sp. NRRL S-836]|uniref:PadR family transcriptional regulator n=1 Tax=Nocardia sp. NRRL S-836 TaxID=1519492 RepID=UPI0006AE5A23|nr:helix-turn-helix transcriptional regulator [Nocardia sp. NRRL S-836]
MRTNSRRVLSALAEHPDRGLYGLEIAEATGGVGTGGLLPGTTYPILIRLRRKGWITGRAVAGPDPAAPPRYYFRITAAGLTEASRVLQADAARRRHATAWSRRMPVLARVISALRVGGAGAR